MHLTINEKEELFGYARVRDILAGINGESPQAVIEKLSRAGEQWANGRPQEDDVTFVVMKVKQ